jgi:hypothetical protein
MMESPYASSPWRDPAVLPVTSGLAIASLVLSILWIGGLGSLFGTILAVVALARIGAAQGPEKGAGLAKVGFVVGLVGLFGSAALYTGIAVGGSSTEQRIGIRPLNVSHTKRNLLRATLQPFDFPSGWSSEGGPNAIPGGLSVGDATDDISVANAFGSCIDDRSALLHQVGPIPRVESTLFYSLTGIVQNLVAVEPSITTARKLSVVLDRVHKSPCIAKALEPEWKSVVGGLQAKLGVLTDPSVSVSPLAGGHLGDQSVGFTLTFIAYQNQFPIYTYEDVDFIRTGQVDALTTFVGTYTYFDLKLERRLDARVSAHLRSMRLVYQEPSKE